MICIAVWLCLLLHTGCKYKNGVTNVPSSETAPLIIEVSRESGRFGTEVTITGINFGATPEENTVTFNKLEAKVVSAAETGTVEVTVAGQTVAGPEFTYLLTPGYVDDGISGGNFRFNEPVFIRWMPNPPDCCGKLYVSEESNHTIRSIIVDGGSTATAACTSPICTVMQFVKLPLNEN